MSKKTKISPFRHCFRSHPLPGMKKAPAKASSPTPRRRSPTRFSASSPITGKKPRRTVMRSWWSTPTWTPRNNQTRSRILLPRNLPLSFWSRWTVSRSGPVKAANAAGIPVFTVDAMLGGRSQDRGHAGTDNFQGGELAGQAMIQALGDRAGGPRSRS